MLLCFETPRKCSHGLCKFHLSLRSCFKSWLSVGDGSRCGGPSSVCWRRRCSARSSCTGSCCASPVRSPPMTCRASRLSRCPPPTHQPTACPRIANFSTKRLDSRTGWGECIASWPMQDVICGSQLSVFLSKTTVERELPAMEVRLLLYPRTVREAASLCHDAAAANDGSGGLHKRGCSSGGAHDSGLSGVRACVHQHRPSRFYRW